MIVPLAHAGHWAASMLYLVPLFILGLGVLHQRRTDRRARKERGDSDTWEDEDPPYSD